MLELNEQDPFDLLVKDLCNSVTKRLKEDAVFPKAVRVDDMMAKIVRGISLTPSEYEVYREMGLQLKIQTTNYGADGVETVTEEIAIPKVLD